MRRAAMALLAVLVVAVPGLAGDDDKEKGKKPEMFVRATPKFAFSPASILFTVELRGGDDIEELYCPEIEWEWGDGGKSISEGDCDPWEPGMKITRRYTARHEYARAGRYQMHVNLRRADKAILSQTLAITVRAGLGDPTMEY